MKAIIVLSVLVFSSLSFSDTIFVKKTVTDPTVSAADGEKVRDALRKVVTDQGHKLANTSGQAQVVLRAVLTKPANGPFIVKVERVRGGKLVGTYHGSDASLDEATRLATTTLVEAIGKALPEKTNVTQSAPVDATMLPDTSGDNRNVAASPAPGGTAISDATASVEAKHPNYIKNWIIALGPVVSNSLVGSSSNGTKFGITFAYTQGLSEHFNLNYFYDSNFNTASAGGTATADFGVGVRWFFFDRLSDFSPWFELDAAYGGGNRSNDSTFAGAGTVGVDIFRTQSSTFMVYLRELVFDTSNYGSQFANLPNITQFMLGINF